MTPEINTQDKLISDASRSQAIPALVKTGAKMCDLSYMHLVVGCLSVAWKIQIYAKRYLVSVVGNGIGGFLRHSVRWL